MGASSSAINLTQDFLAKIGDGHLFDMSASTVKYGIMHMYNIDDPYCTGRIDLPSIVKIIYTVCTCIHVYIIIIDGSLLLRIIKLDFFLLSVSVP